MHNQMEERSEDTFRNENVDDKQELINQIMDNERVYLHIFDYETREFSGLTTYHGLVRIYNSKTWPSRIFWCCVVMSCLSLFMIHSGILLWTYHQKPTLTQVNIIVPEKGIIFPEVTICNINPISFKKTQNWNMSDEVLDYVLKAYNDDASASEIILTKQEEKFQNYLKIYYNNTKKNFSFFDFFYNTGHDCNSMIKACSWGGEIIKNCCSKVEYVMTDYGRCLKFSNKDQQLKQRFSGSHFGWEFVIDIKYNDRPQELPPDFSDVGIKMLIHEVDKTSMIRSNGIGIPVGSKLYAGLDVKNITLLPKDDWGNCQKNWDPSIHGDNLINHTYSTGMCQRNCMIKKMKEQCNCVSLSRLGHIINEKICSPLELYNCMKKITGNHNYLNCQCNVECFRIEYSVHTSYSRLHYTSKHLNNIYNVTKDYFINNYVGTAIYFREITYELHEQQKQMQTADLLSNIAGSMGLFLGMSTVTLLEIFIYLFKSIWGNVNKDRQTQFTEAMLEEYADEINNDIIVMSSDNNKPIPEIEKDIKNNERRFSIFNINKDPIERKNSMVTSNITSLQKKTFDDIIRRNSINPTSISVHPPSHHLNVFNNIARRPSQNFITSSQRPSFMGRHSFQVDENKLYSQIPNNSNIPVIINQPVSSQPRRLSIFDAFQRQNLNNDQNQYRRNFNARRNSAFIPNNLSTNINQETPDKQITIVLNKNNNRRYSTQFPTRHRDSFIY
ncbi:Na+ channel, amiloride-sensitive family-containing protein [Strongyloides ratti]|uniref:Na+ channel, amiloride-sensitive family-containing protein n=1 Tax=Strongyloides ratti TaxID=34506 RepID=A0A090LSG5_STRRB|nr:Na+ channel, amiloride-sensitive family-containing protein [Strongyloides ratti]CEF71152.1 Na+ channel, amiloride-sensitive family-containing protein [Strongyloides ratti]